MSAALHHLSVKGRRTTGRAFDVLLTILLSWAAIDHLLRPKDVQDILRDTGLMAIAAMKAITAVAINGLTPVFFFRPRSRRTAGRHTFFTNHFQTT